VPGHPAGRRIGFLPLNQIQLGGVVLDVAQAVHNPRIAHPPMMRRRDAPVRLPETSPGPETSGRLTFPVTTDFPIRP
jgi:hypothetical protein